ncbi:hypothetical protein V0U79_06715 [Hyphobacterium sp. HN65]|uniref:CTP synthetase n=1 Tax=Hyphobacterium lacteum TaxID=3116575 RepID=A0ABU7LQ73_9PROT|nr:hypothetical protein [Hyphobacterium sp. HN65]MEE2526052.1 hypothetical protein [Hyphobacterium sp. HN65]
MRAAFILVVTLVFGLLVAALAYYLLAHSLWGLVSGGIGFGIAMGFFGLIMITLLAAYVYSAFRLIKKNAE